MTASLRRPVTLPWVPQGLRLELEFAARPGVGGDLVPIRSRAGRGPLPRRGWLVAALDAPPLSAAALGRDAEWILGAATRRWSTIAKRFRLARPEDEVERLARVGAIQIECTLTDELTLEGYAGWALTGDAAQLAEQRATARRSARTALERELREEDLVQRLRDRRLERGMSWEDNVLVLRAAEKWRSIAKNKRLPTDRELAAMVKGDSKWRWTSARRRLLAEIVGCDERALFTPRRRVIRVKGTVNHDQASIWADAVDTVPLALSPDLRGIVCIENSRTLDALYPYGSRGWILLEIGGALPDECRLLERLHGLAPHVPVLAAFDPDPAGIEIALFVASRSGVAFDVSLMSPAVLGAANHKQLVLWDEETLEDLRGRAGLFEPLRAVIADSGHKGEQEGAHDLLLGLLERRTNKTG